MYAVIETGGKQYRVEQGGRLRVEKLDAAEGDDIAFDKVLLVGEGSDVTVGKLVAGAGAEVASFVRFEVGEGIEVEKVDFADEVAAQLNG